MTKKDRPKNPKPSVWSRLLAAVGNAIGQAKFGGVQKYAQNVKLAAHYDPNKSEDVSFAAATPSGELNIYVSNPEVVGSFEPGKCYYLHLIPC